jgi:hypothetical protein
MRRLSAASSKAHERASRDKETSVINPHKFARTDANPQTLATPQSVPSGASPPPPKCVAQPWPLAVAGTRLLASERKFF